jgi:hypothetical protein
LPQLGTDSNSSSISLIYITSFYVYLIIPAFLTLLRPHYILGELPAIIESCTSIKNSEKAYLVVTEISNYLGRYQSNFYMSYDAYSKKNSYEDSSSQKISTIT